MHNMNISLLLGSILMVFASSAPANAITPALEHRQNSEAPIPKASEMPQRSFSLNLGFLPQRSILAQQSIQNLVPYRGSVSIVYNLRDAIIDLQLPAKTLAEIFQGELTNWQQVHVLLPQQEIKVVTLTGSSLTNLVFTRYLNHVTEGAVEATWDPAWTNRLIYAKPKKDGEIAGIVDRTPGAIGYVSSVLAEYYDMPTVRIKDLDGTYLDRIN
jgi:hypothetical protein